MAGDRVGVLGQQVVPPVRIVAGAGPQIGIERRLGIDHDTAAVRQADHDVGPPGPVGATGVSLLDEIGMRDHAGLLQDPTELQLAPHATHPIVVQCPCEAPRLGPDLLVGSAQLTHGAGEHRRFTLTLLLQSPQAEGVLLQSVHHRLTLCLPAQLGALLQAPVAGLGEREELT